MVDNFVVPATLVSFVYVGGSVCFENSDPENHGSSVYFERFVSSGPERQGKPFVLLLSLYVVILWGHGGGLAPPSDPAPSRWPRSGVATSLVSPFGNS